MTRETTNELKRSRSATRAIRHRQIVAATIDSINKVGFAETTLATVAKEAGISQASLIFHFKTKDALLTETLRQISLLYKATWQEALDAASKDPISRVCALVRADFMPKVCNRKSIAVWFAFWGEAKSRPTYMQICGEHDQERYDTMVRECSALAEMDGQPPTIGRELAAIIDSLSDGLWLRLLIYHRTFKRGEALTIMFAQLRALFPNHIATIADNERRA